MSTFTREDYKIAIRDRYRIAIKEDATGVLSNPTPGELRDFYFRIFEKGLSKTDKEIMDVFFGVKENFPLRMAIEGFNTGKLKSIILFFEGGNTNNKSRIEMMAILVDFKPRPFSKFQENKGVIEEDIIKDNNSTERPTEKESVTAQNKSGDKKDLENKNEIIIKEIEEKPIKNIFFERLLRLLKKSKWTFASVAIIFGLTGTIIYFALFHKGCMQWSEDHYEIVDCTFKSETNLNPIIALDNSLLDFRKLKVCDTTTCFKPNGEPIIWYVKYDNKVDFFNTHGMHPLNDKALRPISQHIFERYKKPCTSR
jgi:hypothetical protein